jgi:thiol-disulfide isomerase/thioredoxin
MKHKAGQYAIKGSIGVGKIERHSSGERDLFICLLSIATAAQDAAPLPEFSLLTLKGQAVTSQELKDSIVVLDFWATWCEGCITEIPAFNRLEKKYSPRGVKVIGMAVQSGWAKDIRRFAKLYKMRYTLLVGNDDIVSPISSGLKRRSISG